MTEWHPSPEFEYNIYQAFQVPAIRSEFKQSLYDALMVKANEKMKKTHRIWFLRPVWVVILTIITILIVGTLIIGPQRVYAAVRQLFGYIPGIGIIEQNNNIRILAEPVSVTRDGITLTIIQAVLTDTETRIIFGVSGVPLSAYPPGEAVSGCMNHEYLRLPDGTNIDIASPIPLDVNEVVFVLPCIFNTLPGSVPEQWEIPLHFIPAPPDFQILPVVNVTSDSILPQSTAVSQPTDSSSVDVPIASVSVERMIETADGYILMGYVLPHLPEDSWLQMTGAPVIRDADGRSISYTFPMDIQPLDDSGLTQGGVPWSVQFQGAGVRFPITISFSGVSMKPVDPSAEAKTIVDVGETPFPGQAWNLDREIQLAGKTIRLVSLTAQADGYSFQIDLGSAFAAVSIAIEGYTAVGGGGGGPYLSLAYPELPRGALTIVFSNPIESSAPQTWQTVWQPDQLREFPTGTDSGLCFNANTIQSIPALPAGLNGKIILTQMNPQLQIIITSFQGADQQALGLNAARAAMNLDGTLLAYTADTGIVILNLANGSQSTLPGSFGRDIQWSPDSRFLAVVNADGQYGIFLVNLETASMNQLTNLGYEALAGWSSNGTTLYYTIPGASDLGFLLRAVNVHTGETHDMFVLENSSRKAPYAALSPDDNWIAYRASDNSSLYLKRMDGSPARMLLENPAQAINGIAWDKESHLLAVSLMTNDFPDGEIFLIAPDSCESYRLSGMTGEVDAILIP